MRRALMKVGWLALLLPLVAASCKDDPPPDDPQPPPEVTACLEQPGELATPPAGQLPCELLPPGFKR
jgi:hypothetical protein